MYRDLTLCLHFLRSPAQHRNDRYLGGDREHEWPLLERAKLVRAPPSPLRKHDHVEPTLDALRGLLVRAECSLPVVALDVDRCHLASGAPEQRHAPDLLLGDEAIATNDGRECKDLEPAHVVGHVHARLRATHALRIADHDLHAGNLEHPVRPPVAAAAHHAVRRNRNSKQHHDGDGDDEDQRHQHHHGISEKRAHVQEKWLNPSAGASRSPFMRTVTPMPSGTGSITRPTAVSESLVARVNALTLSAGAHTISSYSSPLMAASCAVTPSCQGSASRSIWMRTPLAAAMWPASASSPSEMSIPARAPERASQIASEMRATGRAKRSRAEALGTSPRCHAASAAPGPPSVPVTYTVSPMRALLRRSGADVLPSTVSARVSSLAPVMSPPRTRVYARSSASPTPSPSSATTSSHDLGRPIASSTPSGAAAIAARSLSAAIVARYPISCGVSHARSK